jgi:hypothetical protein
MLAPEPSFVMYRANAMLHSMRYVGVPLREDFELDVPATVDAIEREQPALVFLAYPNNPTGNVFALDAIEDIIRATKDNCPKAIPLRLEQESGRIRQLLGKLGEHGFDRRSDRERRWISSCWHRSGPRAHDCASSR